MKNGEGKKPEDVFTGEVMDRRNALKRIARTLSGAAIVTVGTVLLGDPKEASAAYASWQGYSAYASWSYNRNR
ncbi:MAG: hypothetical protein M1398_00800 [Deltaproteobacteria bacterium]|jgi:hypothetical protein|nr:hypothetical protein [Deltaproteobacteria bacterium]MDA8307077.1 hypothetical protein [Deltaproteobacteria bacterium]